MSLPGKAFVPVVWNRNLFEANPANHAANEPKALWHAVKLFKNPACHQPEVAGITRDRDI